MSENQYNRGNVEFEGEHNVLYRRFEPSNKVPVFVQFVIKLGFDEQQANHILLGFVIISIIGAVYFFSSLGSGHPPSKAEMERIPLPGSQAPSR